MVKAITRYTVLLAGMVLIGCISKENPSADRYGTTAEQGIRPDQNNQIVVAEQIVYDVEILNPNPDDLWTSECIGGLDHEALVDFVFEGLYRNRFSAFDIFEGSPISVKKIKKMEENREFSRGMIGKFQFMEEWVLDTLQMSYSKHVTEIRMGLQSFNNNGELTGYAPLMRVVL